VWFGRVKRKDYLLPAPYRKRRYLIEICFEREEVFIDNVKC
jgi:hypothetical protein